jgi:hypothetical protein
MNKPSICYGIIPEFCDQVGEAFIVDPEKWWVEQVCICSKGDQISDEEILKAYPMPFEVIRYGDLGEETFILAVPGSVMTLDDNFDAELFHERDMKLDIGRLLGSDKLKMFHQFIELYALEGNCGWWLSSFFHGSGGGKEDKVNNPSHYRACGGSLEEDGTPKYETIKVIESFGANTGFCLGNAIKYLLRADYKGSRLEDLKKARWYLKRYLNKKHVYARYDPRDIAKSWRLPALRSDVLVALFRGKVFVALDRLEEEIRELDGQLPGPKGPGFRPFANLSTGITDEK